MCQLLLDFCAIELNHEIAGFDHSPFGCKFNDLQVAGLGWRADGQGFQGLHFAAKLQRIEKFAPPHFNCGQVWTSPRKSSCAQKHSATSEQDGCDRQRLSSQRELTEALDDHDPLPLTADAAFRCEISTSTAAERSGISFGSFPCKEKITVKVRNLLEKSLP